MSKGFEGSSTAEMFLGWVLLMFWEQLPQGSENTGYRKGLLK